MDDDARDVNNDDPPTHSNPPSTRRSTTGDPRVDDAVARLHDLDDLDVARHAAAYDEIHHRLADVLDDAPPTAPTEQ